MFRRKAFLHWYTGEGMDETWAVSRFFAVVFFPKELHEKWLLIGDYPEVTRNMICDH